MTKSFCTNFHILHPYQLSTTISFEIEPSFNYLIIFGFKVSFILSQVKKYVQLNFGTLNPFPSKGFPIDD